MIYLATPSSRGWPYLWATDLCRRLGSRGIPVYSPLRAFDVNDADVRACFRAALWSANLDVLARCVAVVADITPQASIGVAREIQAARFLNKPVLARVNNGWIGSISTYDIETYDNSDELEVRIVEIVRGR